MTMRSILPFLPCLPRLPCLVGCLGLGTLLGGCFEDPIEDPIVPESTSSTTTDDTSTPITATSSPTTDSTTIGPTTDPTTVGPLDTTEGVDDTTTEGMTTESSDSTGPVDPCVAACTGLACGMANACDCGTCDPMVTCADDQSYCALPIGFFNQFPDIEPVNGQVQLGFRFTVFEPRIVRRLGVIAGGAGSDVRLALYDHDGAGPANRIVQTGAVTLFAVGPNEFDVGATPIMPGDYWVMLHTNGLTSLHRTLNGDNIYEEAVRTGIPFGDGFPPMMNDEVVLNDYRYNLYMVVED
jgi:hypothetical protein